MGMDKADMARTLLRNVYDPELGLDIINLGLVYDLKMMDENKLYILMTFTTMGCPVAGTITESVYEAMEPLGFDEVKLDITYNPPWSPEKMTDEAKKRMGWKS